MLIDVAAAILALSILIQLDSALDPTQVLTLRDCALIALGASGLGFAFRGLFAAAFSYLFTSVA